MARNAQIVFLLREQSFNITVTGLLPLTYHYVYYEGKQAPGTQYKPIDGKLGDSLISDENGQLKFVFYVNTNLPSATTTLAEYYSLINALVGKKQLVITNIKQTTLPDDYKTQAFSYAEQYITIDAYKPTDQEFYEGFGEK